MATRGPDAAGEWVSSNERVALGHRRLAIIDLSSSAEQPMAWSAGRYRMVFNGEIYNYRELRSELARSDVAFQTHSDTEVILALYALHGPEMLTRLRGMYAFAIWDEQTESLFLARDPFGIKPLYYSADREFFRFASQVKALEAGRAVSLEPSPAGVVGFLLWGSVPEPHTLRQAIKALPAGHYLLAERGRVSGPCAYVSPPINEERRQRLIGEAIEESVRAHLVSDVPVAVFLSAGLDSALVASIASRFLPGELTSITVRFDSFLGTPWDEGPLAGVVASQLGTRHVERIVGPSHFPDLWHQVMDAMDQPGIDGFNTFVISHIAHELGFKVVLSGLGGDELFGGYRSFQQVPQLAGRAALAARLPWVAPRWPGLAKKVRPSQPKLAGLLKYGTTMPGAYYLWRGLFLPEELPALLGEEFAAQGLSVYDPVSDGWARLRSLPDRTAADEWQQVQALETRQYMRDQLLRDSDWASMAHSLELRVPLVDAQLAASMAALQYQPARSQGKAAAVRAVVPELPQELWDRPKTGFFIPVMDWLEQPVSAGGARSWGRDSRQIALRVLREFAPELAR